MTVAAREVGAKLVYISTAGVFNGKKTSPYATGDKPDPKNFYGHSKYLGELAVQGTLDDYLIVRVCWMMGGGPGKDQKFLVKGIKRLISEEKTGIFHLPNVGSASRYDVAKKIVEVIKSNIAVIPVDSSYFSLDAKGTKNEALEVDPTYMRPWPEALEEYLGIEWMSSDN